MSTPSLLPGTAEPLPTTLTKRVLGLDWSRELPWPIVGGRVEIVSAEVGLSFLNAHRGDLFEGHDRGSRFLSEPASAAKARWAQEMDFFLVAIAGRSVALMVAHPTDWSTYYVRSTSILPEARGLAISRQLLLPMFAQLARHGVDRVEADTAPTNIPCLRTMESMGFYVTSTASSERWGSTLRLTKFLSAEAEAVFVRQFCAFEPQRAQEHSRPSHAERSTP